VDRRFWVADGKRAEFEAVFAAGGIWSELLGQEEGYLETEVRYESADEGRYRVRDFWNWHRDFEIFRGRHQAQYERFESWIFREGMVEREQFLGAYYQDPGDDEGPLPVKD
jgi:hypothetical protein